VPVDRKAKGGAMAGMLESARQELAHGRQIVIFPEGTRTAPGAPPAYKNGLVNLYAATDVACLPVALNSGLFWPRRSLKRYPGTIVIEVLEPVAAGLPRAEARQLIQSRIEAACQRLIAEARSSPNPPDTRSDHR
jgi:1-acyl-sn-glycerol-3-phosphate acyltransferase